ncbi:SWC5 (YBR231C) [Zygosaccharomyces parabailii]|uniref:SWR1-complex protein 5 n=1 Tax=Zygosaccharomyces bailii (strain CLIB 213 / ATCC 58445 / CBS 680 / BCRC 21525 / NBRC 1098 / NCYC 1416 / NRRL Y-2227) TaxID=1333698 RepID=A0A8J2T5S1_ZYGB2|nr:SWC5 (YBR231C) [Zygosaccharomyces parabailii]CDF88539.1 BN860_12618g1_1 [Zygosaccharomyces bailii CLIB 213]CDH14584.1 related to SWR1-complex protein 5 [Zygosaccharomyces bailii ISA1307]
MLKLQADVKGSGDLIEDEEEYNEEDDVDFDPTKANEGSEDEDEEENYTTGHDETKMNGDYAQIESETGGLVRTRRARQLEEEQRKRHKYDTLQDVSASEEVKDLWEDLKRQASRRLRTDISKQSVMAEDDPLNSKAVPETQILIKRDYKFAGEMVHEEKMVPISSAEAKEYLNSLKFQHGTQEAQEVTKSQPEELKQQAEVSTETKNNLRRPLKRPPLLEQIISGALKPKLTTLEKSSLDWASYVDKEGINEELTLHNKDGYLAKQDFLNRVESFKDQQYKKLRQKQLSMQLQSQGKH